MRSCRSTSITGLVKPSLKTSPSALPCTEHQGLTGPARKTLSQNGNSQPQELLLGPLDRQNSHLAQLSSLQLPQSCRVGPRDATERIPSSGKEELSDSLLVGQRGSVLSLLGFSLQEQEEMMPILNSPMDIAEVNAPPESVEQNCLSNRTAFWGREVECMKVHFILLAINCINKAALRMFLYATLFSYKIEGLLKLCRNSIVNRKFWQVTPTPWNIDRDLQLCSSQEQERLQVFHKRQGQSSRTETSCSSDPTCPLSFPGAKGIPLLSESTGDALGGLVI